MGRRLERLALPNHGTSVACRDGHSPSALTIFSDFGALAPREGPVMPSSRFPCVLAAVVLTTSLVRPSLGQDGRAQKPNSYYYYGPNKLWEHWHDKANRDAAAQRLGRDTWMHWTWGNQKILRKAAVLAGNLPVPISLDLFRLLDSRKRDTRFRDLGLINSPTAR